jgi:hypothetical protein
MWNPLEAVHDGLEKVTEGLSALEQRINRSTFGRVFRLEGSGHVSCSLLTSLVHCLADSRKVQTLQFMSVYY